MLCTITFLHCCRRKPDLDERDKKADGTELAKSSTCNTTVSEVVIAMKSTARDGERIDHREGKASANPADIQQDQVVYAANDEQSEDSHESDADIVSTTRWTKANPKKKPAAIVFPSFSNAAGAVLAEEKAKENEVQQWLERTVSLPQYYAIFREHSIANLQDVQDLSKPDLESMGICKIAHRNKIIRYAQLLRVGELKEGEFEAKHVEQDEQADDPLSAAQHEEKESAEQKRKEEEDGDGDGDDDSSQSDPFYDEQWAVNKVTNYIGISRPNDLDGAYAENKNSKTHGEHMKMVERFGNIEKFVMDPYSGDAVLDRIDRKIAKIRQQDKQ